MTGAAPPPLPGKPRRTPAAGFVDVLGKLSLLLAVLGVLYALAQVGVLLLIPAGFMDGVLAGEYEYLPALPGLLRWLLQNLLPMAWVTLLSAVAFLVVSYGVLKRSNAARIGFIVFMVLGTVMNFASIAVLIAALDWVNAIGASVDDVAVLQQIRASNMFSMAMGVVSAVAIAGLHGWIIYKLCAADVRAEFNRP